MMVNPQFVVPILILLVEKGSLAQINFWNITFLTHFWNRFLKQIFETDF